MLTEQTELEQLCRKYQIDVDCVYGAAEPWPDEWKGRECHPWTATLRWFGKGGQRRSKQRPRTLTVSFFQGSAHESEPTAADVLSGLLLDTTVENYGSFEAWAADLGYDPDSRRAVRTYQECQKLVPLVRAFLGNDQALIDELRAAEH